MTHPERSLIPGPSLAGRISDLIYRINTDSQLAKSLGVEAPDSFGPNRAVVKLVVPAGIIDDMWRGRPVPKGMPDLEAFQEAATLELQSAPDFHRISITLDPQGRNRDIASFTYEERESYQAEVRYAYGRESGWEPASGNDFDFFGELLNYPTSKEAPFRFVQLNFGLVSGVQNSS